MTVIRKRIYRVYYNVYDDEAHSRAVEELRRRFGRVVDHPSRVHPEFRFVEILVETPGLEEEIARIIRDSARAEGVKVDWIEIRK